MSQDQKSGATPDQNKPADTQNNNPNSPNQKPTSPDQQPKQAPGQAPGSTTNPAQPEKKIA